LIFAEISIYSSGYSSSPHSNSSLYLAFFQAMAQPEATASSGRFTDESLRTSSSTPITTIPSTLLQCHAQNPHWTAADIATRTMHEDEKLTIVRKTGAKKNRENHAIGCTLHHI
jgi:hypothetical protein